MKKDQLKAVKERLLTRIDVACTVARAEGVNMMGVLDTLAGYMRDALTKHIRDEKERLKQ